MRARCSTGFGTLVVGLLLAAETLAADVPTDPSYEETFAATKAAFDAKDYAAAKLNGRKALAATAEPKAGGKKTASIYLLLAETELQSGSASIARRYLQQAARTALDDFDMRKKILRRRLAVAKDKKWLKTERQAQELLEHDRLVQKRSRNPWVAAPKLTEEERNLEKAARAYSRDRDPVRAAWARSVRALVRARSDKDAKAAFDYARRVVLVTSRLPSYVRLPALEAAWWGARRSGDKVEEARYALLSDATANAGLSHEERRFRRSKRTQDSCNRYEKDVGNGACAKLAWETTGEWSLVDYSAQSVVAQLEPPEVKKANAQYLPVIHACIDETVRREVGNELFVNASVTLEWGIDNNGRVIEFSMSPKRYDRYFGQCVRDATSWFRYRRSKGERQFVAVPYQFHATEIQRRRGG